MGWGLTILTTTPAPARRPRRSEGQLPLCTPPPHQIGLWPPTLGYCQGPAEPPLTLMM